MTLLKWAFPAKLKSMTITADSENSVATAAEEQSLVPNSDTLNLNFPPKELEIPSINVENTSPALNFFNWLNKSNTQISPFLHIANFAMNNISQESRSIITLDKESDGQQEIAGDVKLPVSEKLRDLFELPQLEQLKHEFACWLISSVLLQGYIYVTDNHFCFHAHLPVASNKVSKTGYLKRKGYNGYTTYWFVLKIDVLYVFNSSTDVYYPLNTIQLANIKTVEPVENSMDFKLITHKKTYYLRADTIVSKQEWINALVASVFKAKNPEDVRIVIPFENISLIEIQETALNRQCLKIVSIDPATSLVENYVFGYFNDIENARTLLQKSKDDAKPQETRRVLTTLQDDNTHRRARTHVAKLDLPPLIAPVLGGTSPSSGSTLELLNTGLKRSASPTKRWFEHRKTSSDTSPKDGNWTAVGKKESDFQELFGFPGSETLLATFSGYLVKILPHMGKIYVSRNHVSFKNNFVGVRAKAIIPLIDIVHLKKIKRYTMFELGLSVTTKDQEEIMFDFHNAESCQKCFELLNQLMKAPQPIEIKKPMVLTDISHTDVHIANDFDDLKLQPTLVPNQPKKPSPMRITILTVGTRGDVQPYIALCQGLMKHGHDCSIATHLEYQSWVQAFGIHFKELKGNPAELMQLCVDHGMFTVSFLRHAYANLRGWVVELLESCEKACQDTDLIIEAPAAMGGVHMAEKLGIPYFKTFTMPWTRTQVYPHPFSVPEVSLGSNYNYITHVTIEQLFWKALSPMINAWRVKDLQLPALHLSSLADINAPFLYNFSPLVVPPPFDWPDWIHTCGYWFLDDSEHSWTPPDSLLEFMNNGTKPIYIGFGSIIVPDPDEMTRVLVEAIKLANVRVILSKGWSGRSSKTKQNPIQFPDCIYLLDRVPHDWLFPRVSGVFHHGGAGTTAAGLRAGIPTLIRPFFGDQYFWADRIQELGVGYSIKKFTVTKVAQALENISQNQKIVQKAKSLGEKIRAENGVEAAIQYIYRDLDLSRKIVEQLKTKE